MVVSLALLAGTAACKKEGGAAGSGGSAGDDLNVVPSDSDIVMNIDLAKLRASGVYKEFGEKLLSKVTKDVSEFKETCGFDPVETVKSFSLGIKLLDDKGRGSVVIHSSAPKDKLKACLEKSKAKAEAKGTTITIEGDIAYLTSKDNDGFVALTFIGTDGVVALINDTAWTKEKVEAALKGGGSIKSNKPVMDMIGALKKDQTLWFYLNGASKIAKQAEQAGIKAQGFFGSLNVTDGLSIDFRARMATAEEAKATADALKGQLTQAQMFFTKIESRADGSDFRVDAELTGSQLKGVASMAGMGGGGGGGDHDGHDHEAPAKAPEAPVAPAPEAPAAPAAPAPAQ